MILPFRFAAAAAVFGLLLVGGIGCKRAAAPVFETSSPVDGEVLMLPSEVRLGSSGVDERERQVSVMLEQELRAALTAKGLPVTRLASSEEVIGQARRLLLNAWTRTKVGRRGRLKVDQPLLASGGVELLQSTGAEIVAVAILTKRGVGGDSEFIPIPEGELFPYPDEEFDYVIPDAREWSEQGSSLDLLLVRARDGRVVAHRKVQHPASSVDEIFAAMPLLVRETTRGLRRE